jgi:RNA polymerase sigma factor FliA
LILQKEHYALVRYVARSMKRRLPSHIELDELVQVGMVGLVRAAARFDSTRECSFETYARKLIYGAILDELRNSEGYRRNHGPACLVPLDAPLFLKDGEQVMFADIVPSRDASPEETATHSQLRRHLEKAMEALEHKERQVIQLYFFQGIQSRDIAPMLGLSEGRIWQIRKRALARLSHRLQQFDV